MSTHSMRVAVACERGMVSRHFGHCECFCIYDIEDGQIVMSELVPNPGHQPGMLPRFLSDKEVDAVITGGMGGSAIEIFKQKKIDVITGVSGDALVAVERYLQGQLASNPTVCHEHLKL